MCQSFTTYENIPVLYILKSVAGNFNVTQTVKLFKDSVGKILGNRENALYQHFLLFPQYFQRASFPGSLKVGIVWYRLAEHENCLDKEGNTGNQHFFPQYFVPFQREIPFIHVRASGKDFVWEKPLEKGNQCLEH